MANLTSAKGKLIVALDYSNPEQAYRLVEDLGDLVQCYKLGPLLYTYSGPEVIRFLHRKNKRIFLDLKLHDTPAVVGHTVRQFAELGVDFATIHCLGGRKMMEAAAFSCRGSRLKLLGITLLTSHGSEDFSNYFRWEYPNELLMELFNGAIESRMAGILCSPHELDLFSSAAVPGFLKVTAGIRPKGVSVFEDDQHRVASPEEALSKGADLLIIGRPITQALQPREVVLKLY